MSQEIKNVLNNFAYDRVLTIMKNGGNVTPAVLDEWENELHGSMQEHDQKIGKGRIRELLVCYIIGEFDIVAFGLPLPRERMEVSEAAIKKMKKQRKNGFDNMKMVKVANGN